MVPFPILKLPLLPFKNVTQYLNFSEVLTLSETSERTTNYLKTVNPKNRYKINAAFNWTSVVELQDQKYSNQLAYHVPSFSLHGPKRILSMNEKDLIKIKGKVDQICNVFNCNLNSLQINSDLCFLWLKSIIEWLPPVETLSILGMEFDQKYFEFFIQNSQKIKKKLEINLPSATPFEFPPKFEMDFLRIRGRPYWNQKQLIVGSEINWIRMEDIMNFDCIHINLGLIKAISENDLNGFLKAWINGSNYRMEYFHVELFKNLNLKKLINGIKTEGINQYENRVYNHPELNESCEFKGGYKIRRKDGTMATFHQKSEETVTFQMVVWK